MNMTDAVSVICAYPLSGQYGPGARFSLYILILACIVWRKQVLVLNVGLGAVLLAGLVAAVHGVALGAVSGLGDNKHVLDFDVFGAAYICTFCLGLVPGLILLGAEFLSGATTTIVIGWYALMLAGETGVTAALFRAPTRGSPCVDAAGANISHSVFIVGETDCHLSCMDIPTLPLRQGQSAVYIQPDSGPVDIAALGSLAGIALCLLTMPVLYRIFRQGPMKSHMGFLMLALLMLIEGPPGAITLAVLSEIRVFWGPQVRYQVESMAAVGQWSPFVTAFFAIIGGLLINAADDE
ncbi:hypothetical protein MVEN_01036200 [Mycena venus]|uniref:Uncharacterized protein n=1 Tax=Mycena venus TaxID=2733690 RepID=A0A8H7D2U8_9AGAR|nr:hypothetical protein MVEN_01036200 [Mycena venus]